MCEDEDVYYDTPNPKTKVSDLIESCLKVKRDTKIPLYVDVNIKDFTESSMNSLLKITYKDSDDDVIKVLQPIT